VRILRVIIGEVECKIFNRILSNLMCVGTMLTYWRKVERRTEMCSENIRMDWMFTISLAQAVRHPIRRSDSKRVHPSQTHVILFSRCRQLAPDTLLALSDVGLSARGQRSVVGDQFLRYMEYTNGLTIARECIVASHPVDGLVELSDGI